MPKDIRLIGLDLDDTALNSEKQLTPRVRGAISRAIEAGIEVLPATGRAISAIPEAFLEIPGVRYAVASNGAMVYDLQEKKTLHRDCLTPADALEMLAIARCYNTYVAIFIDGLAYGDPIDEERLRAIVPPSTMPYLRGTRIPVADLEAVLRAEDCASVEKLNVMFASMDDRAEARRRLLARGDCAVTSSLPGNLEVNTATANKGAALLLLGRFLGFGREQIMAVGDGSNDAEMLRQAGYGVAMAGGHPTALAAANATTACADEDGVALAIEKVLAGQA